MVLAVLLAMGLAGCGGEGGEEPEARQCEEANTSGVEISGPYGTVTVPHGYEVVEGESSWAVEGGQDRPLFVVTPVGTEADRLVEELEAATGHVFVEVCAPNSRGWLSAPLSVGNENGRAIVGVLETSGGALVVGASLPDGGGIGVRGGLESFLASFEVSG